MQRNEFKLEVFVCFDPSRLSWDQRCVSVDMGLDNFCLWEECSEHHRTFSSTPGLDPLVPPQPGYFLRWEPRITSANMAKGPLEGNSPSTENYWCGFGICLLSLWTLLHCSRCLYRSLKKLQVVGDQTDKKSRRLAWGMKKEPSWGELENHSNHSDCQWQKCA